jgi:DHA1 family bicyclomycin/chloramphenicol resistance-like MFS transporter
MPWHPAVVIAFLTGLIASGHISTNIYAPSLPSMVTFFGTDAASVQMTISVYMACFAFGQLVYGPLSDRFGRRPVLLGGLVIFVATTLLIIVLPSLYRSIDLVIIGRGLQALGACAGPVVARAIMRDLYTREETAKVMAYVALAMGLAPAFAPVLGGYLEVWFDWRASFAAVLVFAAAVFLAALRMPETNKHRESIAAENPITMITNYRQLLVSREYWSFISAGSLVFGAMFVFQVSAPFVTIELLGYSPAAYGWISVSGIAGYMIGSLVTSRITDRVGVDRMVPLGVGLVTIGGAAFFIFGVAGHLSVWSVFGPLSFMAFGMAILFPSTLAGSVSVYPRIAGAAAALYGFIQMMAAAVTITIVGMLEDGTHMPMVWVISVAVAGAFLAVLVSSPSRNRRGGPLAGQGAAT